jgi:hypothetical protein
MSHADARLVARSIKAGYLNLRVKGQRVWPRKIAENASQNIWLEVEKEHIFRDSLQPHDELIGASRSPLTQIINYNDDAFF